jgi:DNA-binding MarR family transcriptional regulator
LNDPRTIRAMAHPLRLRLLVLLFTEGPLTASQCAEHVGESPASCSFHLRQLAKYGYVEEAGGGRGRERPWQVVLEVTQVRESELSGEASLAAEELIRVLGAKQVELHEQYWRTRRSYPKDWQDAAIESSIIAFATVEEMAEFKARLEALALEFADRHAAPDARPPGAQPVALIIQGFPMRPPPDDPRPPASPASGDAGVLPAGSPDDPASGDQTNGAGT